jgi:LysM repeat protein
MRKIIFKDNNEELILPVTPASFKIGAGIKVETINITAIGDVNIGSHGTLASISLDSFFPQSEYDFASKKFEPYEYIEWFKYRSWMKTVLRFIVSDTGINLPVLVENIDYGEQDGAGDVYYNLSLREYRYVNPIITAAETNAPTRASEQVQTDTITHYIKSGDTLSAISRKYYGNANLWQKLAAYNGIKGSLIIAGRTLQIPPIGVIT